MSGGWGSWLDSVAWGGDAALEASICTFEAAGGECNSYMAAYRRI